MCAGAFDRFFQDRMPTNMNKHWFAMLLVFTVFCCGTPLARSTETDPAASPPKAKSLVRQVLSSKPDDLFVVLQNGLTLLIRRQPENNVVSTQVFVHAGSITEGKYLTAGLSHYLEHVLAGGSTKSFTEAQAKDRLAKMGGETNAYTSYDRTVFYINTSGNRWKDALDLLLSYVGESVLDPGEVTREKAVIQQEMRMGENDPARELSKLFMKTAYQVHPSRDPVIGYENVFIQQDRDALQDYYLSRYQPQNMVVVVVGNVVPSEVVDFVSAKTKDFKRRAELPVSVPDEPPQTTMRWEETENPVDRLTKVMIGFPSVTIYDKDAYALDVLAFLLGQGQTCRLYCRLQDQENRVLNINASNWTPSYVNGQFIISLTLPPENWPASLDSIKDEIEGFKQNPVTQEELERAQKATIAQNIFERESVASVAAQLASSYFSTGDPYFADAYDERVRRVTAEEIRDVAQRYLVFDRMNVAVSSPPKPEVAASQQPPTVPSSKDSVEKTQPELRQLPNGLRVLLKRDTKLPMAVVQVFGSGGTLYENQDKPGLSSFTASLLTAGTPKRNKLQIHQSLEDVGGEIGSSSGFNTWQVSTKILRGDLNLALDVVSDVIRNPEFPSDEIEKKRKETLLAIQRNEESWQGELSKLFRKNYFENSPYRNDRLGTPESVGAFSREDVQAAWRRMANPHQTVLAVYGDIDPQKTFAEIEKLFASWSGENTPPPKPPKETERITDSRVVEKKTDKSSAALFIGTNGLDIDDADRPVLDVIDSVLSGAGTPGGRLFTALRGGNENLVYVVGAHPFYGKNAGYYGVITQTTLANLNKVQGIIMEQLRKIATEAVPEGELADAEEMILTALHLQNESLRTQAETAAVDEVLSLGMNYQEQYIKKIKAVKAEDVKRLAGKLLAHTLTVRLIPEKPVNNIISTPVKNDVH